jgi:hypothetical protein
MKFTKRSSSSGDQFRLKEFIETSFESVPSPAERAPCDHIFRQTRIQPTQSGSEYATVSLGEKHGHATPKADELVSLGTWIFAINPFRPIRPRS